MSCVSIEDLIWRAAADECKHGPAALSFASIYSFTAAVVEMARGQERQAILEAFQQIHPQKKSRDYGEGYEAAFATLMRILVQRSMV